MRGFVPEDILDSIRSRVDIVQVIGECVPLKKRGNNYVGSCPFHQEKNPSFTVSPEKQIFYCFGCGAGGNVFKFLMLYNNIGFYEAVRLLADRAGVVLPVGAPEDAKWRREKERILKANLLARDFFRQFLQSKEAVPAREYLASRGITPDLQEVFQIGYAPPRRDALLEYLELKGYRPEELVEMGLALNKEGRYIDRFRSRIIFPICDARGQVVGFGGRVLGDGQPKYLNSPETPIFNKRQVLYGLHLAVRSIRERGFAVIMEGYMDVITAHRCGVTNAVASLGTSLTGEQGSLLQRYTRDVMIAFDTDAAGVAATLRGLDLLREQGLRVRVITLPEGKDPDEFISLYGAERWQELVERAEHLIEYKLRQALKRFGFASKAAALEEILPDLAGLKSEVERAEAVKLVAAMLHTSWDAVAGELRRFIDGNRKKWPKSDKIAKNKHNIKYEQKSARWRAESVILRILLENANLINDVVDVLGKDIFQDPSFARIFKELMGVAYRPGYRPAVLFDYLSEDDQKVLSALLMEEIPGKDPVEILPAYVEALIRCRREEYRAQLMRQLAEAQRAEDRVMEAELMRKIKQTFQISKKCP